jgi:hypothetical protein
MESVVRLLMSAELDARANTDIAPTQRTRGENMTCQAMLCLLHPANLPALPRPLTPRASLKMEPKVTTTPSKPEQPTTTTLQPSQSHRSPPVQHRPHSHGGGHLEKESSLRSMLPLSQPQTAIQEEVLRQPTIREGALHLQSLLCTANSQRSPSLAPKRTLSPTKVPSPYLTRFTPRQQSALLRPS